MSGHDTRSGWLVVAIVVFAGGVFSSAPYAPFCDEDDNMLGARALLDGEVLYRDYWSHHGPGAYVAAMPLVAVSGANVALFRLVYGAVLSIAGLALVSWLWRRRGPVAAVVFAVATAVGMPYFRLQAFTAESLTAVAAVAVTAWFLAYEPAETAVGTGKVWCLSLATATGALSSPAYLFHTALVAAVTWFVVRRARRSGVAVPSDAHVIAAFAAPYAVWGIYLVATDSFDDFLFCCREFNVTCYGRFMPMPSGLPSALAGMATRFLGAVWSLATAIPAARTALGFTFFLVLVVYGVTECSEGRPWRAGFALVTVVTLTARLDITVLPLHYHTVGPYFMQMSLLLALALQHWWSRRSRRAAWLVLPILAAVAVVWLVFFGAERYDMRRRATLVDERPLAVAVVDRLVDDGDRVWFGPISFRSFLFCRARSASRHRFFAPWHAASPRVVDELLSDLRRNRPVVVVFPREGTFWDVPIASYAAPLLRLLDEDYVPFGGVYIREDQVDRARRPGQE